MQDSKYGMMTFRLNTLWVKEDSGIRRVREVFNRMEMVPIRCEFMFSRGCDSFMHSVLVPLEKMESPDWVPDCDKISCDEQSLLLYKTVSPLEADVMVKLDDMLNVTDVVLVRSGIRSYNFLQEALGETNVVPDGYGEGWRCLGSRF